jgi:hypothetical protein
MRRLSLVLATLPALLLAGVAVFELSRLPPAPPSGPRGSTLTMAYGNAVADAMGSMSRDFAIMGIWLASLAALLLGCGALALRGRGRVGPVFVLVLGGLAALGFLVLLYDALYRIYFDAAHRYPLPAGPFAILGMMAACEVAAGLLGLGARRSQGSSPRGPSAAS